MGSGRGGRPDGMELLLPKTLTTSQGVDLLLSLFLDGERRSRRIALKVEGYQMIPLRSLASAEFSADNSEDIKIHCEHLPHLI